MREAKAMGRPREFDTDAALSRIMDVFWAKGYEGSSMSDLEAATGLRKGSLYAAFGDKRAMYLKALALYDRTAIDAGVEVLSGAGPAEQRIGAFLQLAIDADTTLKDRRGCFLCNASVDQAMLDPATEQAVKSSLKRLARAMEQALPAPDAGRAGGPERETHAHHLLSVYFGLRVLAKGGYPVSALRQAKQAALRAMMPPG